MGRSREDGVLKTPMLKFLLIPVLFADALLNLFWHLYYDKNHLKYVHRTQALTDFYEELDVFIIAKNSH